MVLFLGMRCCPFKRLRFYFVYFLWVETKLSIVDGPPTLVHFIDWMSSRCWGGFFLYIFL